VIVPRLTGGWLVKGAAAGMPTCFCHTIERAHEQARAFLESNGGGEVVVREGARVITRLVVSPRTL
jgi:hypothetical protein